MTRPKTISRSTKSTELDSDYKWGFVTDIEEDIAPMGLNEEIVRFISAKKGEPQWMLDWRLRAYRYWMTLNYQEPKWSKVRFPRIDYQDIYYYAAPVKKKGPENLDEVDPELIAAFNKLGIPLAEQKMIPFSSSDFWSVVATDTLSNTASTATPVSFFCSSRGMPSLLNAARSSGSTSSMLSGRFSLTGDE